MPVYDYRCDICNSVKSVEKSIHDNTPNPDCCDKPMNQVYSAVGVKFKGTGFYSTGG
jgi:putative FmdB family regulatory protein